VPLLKNGEGKSTMIKAIMKELQIDSGVLEIGHNAQLDILLKTKLRY
jgi:ATPase subunit of ABC transporter with duplicated ATPase domains